MKLVLRYANAERRSALCSLEDDALSGLRARGSSPRSRAKPTRTFRGLYHAIVPPEETHWNDQRFIRSFRFRKDWSPDFDAYPFNIPAIKAIRDIDFAPGVTFLVGENGSGKSTLLEALAILVNLNPEGGSKNYRAANQPTESDAWHGIELQRGLIRESIAYFFRSETFFNVLSEARAIEEVKPGHLASYGGDLHNKSHGQATISFMANRLWPNGLFLMDEPESALSPQKQLEFLGYLHQYLGKNRGQFVIATHSPILLAYPNARIYRFDDEGIKEIPYEETEHYQLYLGFMKNPRRALTAMGIQKQ